MFHTLLQSAPAWAWLGFHGLVFLMLALDLGVFNRKVHAPSMKEAATWSGVWIALALGFNALVFYGKGHVAGTEWFTGYVLEKSLSVDNLFVFVLVFGAFQVESRHQHRILYWGILGALVMRAAMILAGTALLTRFSWMMYAFGAFLVYTGLKMFQADEAPSDPRQSWFVRTAQRILPMDPEAGHGRMLVRHDHRTFITPALLVLLVVEVTDLVFAVDSIPAVLAVTLDPFTVYTSNIFAILGLRSLYFLLANMVDRFHRLKLSLAVILTFVGLKMCLVKWVHIPIQYSLLFIALMLAFGIMASLAKPKQEA